MVASASRAVCRIVTISISNVGNSEAFPLFVLDHSALFLNYPIGYFICFSLYLTDTVITRLVSAKNIYFKLHRFLRINAKLFKEDDRLCKPQH